MRHTTLITALSAALALSTLACAANTQPATTDEQPATAVQPSAQTIARAQAAGLPTVDKGGQIAGPFDGPQDTLYYLKRDGRITFFHPESATGYFGTLQQDGAITFQYSIGTSGQFVFDANAQAQQVPILPDDVYQWPHAEAVAQALIQRLQQIQQGQAAAQQVDWAAASAASRKMHDINMSILRSMDSQGCTERYDGVYYLGCW